MWRVEAEKRAVAEAELERFKRLERYGGYPWASYRRILVTSEVRRQRLEFAI